MILTNKDQPVALDIDHSISEPEFAVLSCEWLQVTCLAGQGCLVQPLISAQSKQHVSQTRACSTDGFMTCQTGTSFVGNALCQQAEVVWDIVTGM